MTRLRILGGFVLMAGIFCLGPLVMAANGSHPPIAITTDSNFQACNCVSSGAGTTTDPYIIGPWAINSAVSGGTAVFVHGAALTKSFTLFNLAIAGNGSSTSTGIMLSHINPSGQNAISAAVTGAQTSIQSGGIGIVVESSSLVTLDGGGANTSGAGIGAAAGTINKNFIGAIDIENSRNITVKGWQIERQRTRQFARLCHLRSFASQLGCGSGAAVRQQQHTYRSRCGKQLHYGFLRRV